MDEITAYNTESIELTEQVMVAETAEGTVVTDETTLTIEGEQLVDETIKAEEASAEEVKEQE